MQETIWSVFANVATESAISLFEVMGISAAYYLQGTIL
jgi:hypothetical protein